MSIAQNKIVQWPETSSPVDGARVAEIVEIQSDGVAVVDFESNPSGPVPARSAIAAPPLDTTESYIGKSVLVTFENSDPSLPVIIGFVRDSLFPEVETELDVPAPDEVVLDGEKLCLDAKEEITLRCGQSAIILKKDGRVVVKGVEITNRALRTNKIKGGTVRIN